jgi:hypothetical protein
VISATAPSRCSKTVVCDSSGALVMVQSFVTVELVSAPAYLRAAKHAPALPSGVIGTNKKDAADTVKRILEDRAAGVLDEHSGTSCSTCVS